MKYRAVLLITWIAADVAWAQPASDHDAVLEEVIVTARFRRQNLQETPLAVSVIDGASTQPLSALRLYLNLAIQTSNPCNRVKRISLVPSFVSLPASSKRPAAPGM